MKYSKDFAAMSNNILKQKIKINGESKFMNPWLALSLPYHDAQEIKPNLLSKQEQLAFFNQVYGSLIHLKISQSMKQNKYV